MVSIVFLNSQFVFADYGRSPLIEFVIEQESHIAEMKQDIQKLLADHKEGVRLKNRCHDLELCIDRTLHDIELMFDTGILFQVQDDFGKTALNYAQTREVYDKLRHCGMPFQYDAWMYINRLEIMTASVLLVAAVCAIGYLHIDEKRFL